MNKITSQQFIFIIIAFTVVSLKTYPTIYIYNSGRDSWIAMIISSAIILIYFIFALKVFQKTNCYNLHYMYCNALGKILGNILYTFFILSLFLTLLIFLIFPAIYCVKKGTRSILSLTIIGMILMTLAGINLFILTSTYKHYENLLPIFENGITSGFLISIIKILGLYGHITICFLYMEHIEKKDKLLKHSLIGFLFVIQMQIISVIGILATFQLERAVRFPYPKLLQTQLVSYWRFIESGEFFVMLQTVGGWYIKYILVLHLVIKCLTNINLKNKYLIYIISVLTFLITYCVAENLLVFLKFLNIYSYISFANFLIVPFMVITIFYFKNKNAAKSCQRS